MNPVVHFEMPYEDRERMAAFYAKAFGWEAQMLGPDMSNYVVVHTDKTDEKGMLQENGRINGGLFEKTPDNAVTSLVLSVDDIQAAMKKVVEAGGKLINNEPLDIPGIGKYVAFTDTEGNRNSMLRPSPRNE